MRRHVGPSSMLLPSVNQKDIEFVIPPTKPPSTTLYGPPLTRPRGGPSGSSANRINSDPTSETIGAKSSASANTAVGRGWNFIADVFTATSTFQKVSTVGSNPQRARSRDSIPVTLNNNSLDIPTIKTSESLEDQCPIQILVDDDEYVDDTSTPDRE